VKIIKWIFYSYSITTISQYWREGNVKVVPLVHVVNIYLKLSI